MENKENETLELHQAQLFDTKLEDIVNMLNTCRGQFTDTEYKDIRVYDRIELLLQGIEQQKAKWVEDELKNAQRKIREAYLSLKDTLETLQMYSD